MKSAGVTTFSRTMERTEEDLRLRRGRERWGIQRESLLFKATEGERPPVGSKSKSPLSGL